MIDQIKTFFFNYRLKQNSVNIISPNLIQNFNQMRSIGILFDASSQNITQDIIEFKKKFKDLDKQIDIYGYTKQDQIVAESYLMSKKDLNWYGYPIKNSAFAFADKSFDVLISVFPESNSPLLSVLSLTKSKLRIGIDSIKNITLLDIVVQVDHPNNQMKSLEIIFNFLKTINSKN
jgi:hypothetical protein